MTKSLDRLQRRRTPGQSLNEINYMYDALMYARPMRGPSVLYRYTASKHH
jgi:hypothetical protein